MHASAVLAQNRASFQTVALFGTPTSSISATRDAHSTFQSQFDGRYYVARRVDWQCRTCAKFCLYVKRSEEHTSELQSHSDLVCRLLLEKKKSDRRVTGHIRKCAVQGRPWS